MHTWLEWQARSTNAGVVLRFVGEVDMATIDEMRDALDENVADRATLIADLAGVGFLSVAGARLLLQTGQTMNSSGGRLIVWRPHPAVERVIHLVGDHALDIFHGSLAAIDPLLGDEPI